MITNWEISDEDSELVDRIIERLIKLEYANRGYVARDRNMLDVEMDLIATHNHGCPMDFEKLLAAPDFDFLHDVYGISRHINRRTGELEDCFLPRCAKREVEA